MYLRKPTGRVYIYIYVDIKPGTQMTPVPIGKDLVLEGGFQISG